MVRGYRRFDSWSARPTPGRTGRRAWRRSRGASPVRRRIGAAGECWAVHEDRHPREPHERRSFGLPLPSLLRSGRLTTARR